jgi:hypothetical protein
MKKKFKLITTLLTLQEGITYIAAECLNSLGTSNNAAIPYSRNPH